MRSLHLCKVEKFPAFFQNDIVLEGPLIAPWPAGGGSVTDIKIQPCLPIIRTQKSLKLHCRCPFFSASIRPVQSSVVWYGGITVPMVDVNGSIAAIVQLKHVSITVVPPPGAQLAVPATCQGTKQFRMLHADHCEEVLITKVASEAILFC